MKKIVKNSVLIVDDEAINIFVLTNILSQEHTVFVAKNGADAIKLAKKRMPDVILLDVLMPDMDGYTVISELKRHTKTSNIPVIFITGLDSVDAEKKGLALGAADYIPKPFSPDIVRLRVHNQLKIVNNTHSLDRRLRQQALMTKIAHSFMAGGYSDSLFSETLQIVGEFMRIDKALLFKYDAKSRVLKCHNEWINPKLKSETRIGSEIRLVEPAISIIKGLQMSSEEHFCVHSNEPAFKEVMRTYRNNSNSYITTPIFIKGGFYAILDFSKKDDGQMWSESEIDLTIFIASIFSGAYVR